MAGAIFLGFLLGMRHALEADHLAAVASLVSGSKTLKDALHQIRMAYVSLEQRDNMTSESEEENSGPETT